ncbi:hypothetical protein PUN28_020494 [Cardiocondyla obscurior]|uniref:Uncharacterized protein n=1 Tax=Cardiocondyla obscurior TaxID=286306 RepID=A0AAW2E540_9HYME
MLVPYNSRLTQIWYCGGDIHHHKRPPNGNPGVNAERTSGGDVGRSSCWTNEAEEDQERPDPEEANQAQDTQGGDLPAGATTDLGGVADRWTTTGTEAASAGVPALGTVRIAAATTSVHQAAESRIAAGRHTDLSAHQSEVPSAWHAAATTGVPGHPDGKPPCDGRSARSEADQRGHPNGSVGYLFLFRV